MGKNYKRLCDAPECMEEAEFVIGLAAAPHWYCGEHYDKIINQSPEQ